MSESISLPSGSLHWINTAWVMLALYNFCIPSCLLTSRWLSTRLTKVPFCLQTLASLSYLWPDKAYSHSRLLYLGCVVASLLHSTPLCSHPAAAHPHPSSPPIPFCSVRLLSTGLESRRWDMQGMLSLCYVVKDRGNAWKLLTRKDNSYCWLFAEGNEQPMHTYTLLISSRWDV